MSTTSLLDIYQQEIIPLFRTSAENITSGSMRKRAAYFGWGTPGYGSGYQTVAGDMAGITDLAGLRAAKGFEYDRLQDRNKMLEEFSKAGEAFNIQMLQQGQAAETFASNLENINTRLGAIRQQGMGSASPASSQRQYSQLAQSAMEGTSRYLQELERFKAPTAPTIDFSFQDPITGEVLQLGTKFEDIYSNGYDPESAAREAIISKFKRLTEEKKSQLLSEAEEKYGTTAQFLEPFGGDEKAFIESIGATRWGSSGSTWRPYDRTRAEYWKQYQSAKAIEADAQQFAEAAAVAEMGDITTVGGQYSLLGTHQFSGTSAFFDQDINQILESFVAPTAERLRISRLDDEKAVREEFKRREQMAQQQYSLYQSQQQRNKEQEMRIEEEKQRVRQMLEQQKREYSETLGSFGDTTSQQGGGIQFADTRPM